MALGGIVGIMNTMYAAISQRTKDVGLLRILGYSRGQVLRSFFLESMLLALLGGLLGCAVGSLANGFTATSILSGGQGGGKSVVIKLVADWSILGIGLSFALVMGCVGGLIPALSAMRLRALESLR
jgi:ABC-type antimicrobial peptide transport system permease subunit